MYLGYVDCREEEAMIETRQYSMVVVMGHGCQLVMG